MACPSTSTRFAVAIAMAPPEPPSPMMTATFGTPRLRQRSVARAMASACPRSSAPTPPPRRAPRRVDQRDHRHAEALRQVQESDGLAVALWPRHAEIVLDAAL